MLKFDETHNNFENKISDKSNKKPIKKRIVIGGVILAALTLFSGCSKTIECNIENSHAHIYENEKGFIQNIISEKEYIDGFCRTEDYILLDSHEVKFMEFLQSEGLMDITQNKDAISKEMEQNKDYLEYEYSYIQYIPLKIGKTTIYMQEENIAWTTDKQHPNLTGNIRKVEYKYYGYKIAVADDLLIAIKSELVDNLDELPPNFLYIKKDFKEKIYTNIIEKDLAEENISSITK